jgi:hypothetical protein
MPAFGGSPKCSRCGKTAYPQESVTYSNQLYHNDCFRCGKCKSRITNVKTIAEFNGDIFHKNCFIKEFKETGGRYGGEKVVASVQAIDDGPDLGVAIPGSEKIADMKQSLAEKSKALEATRAILKAEVPANKKGDLEAELENAKKRHAEVEEQITSLRQQLDAGGDEIDVDQMADIDANIRKHEEEQGKLQASIDSLAASVASAADYDPKKFDEARAAAKRLELEIQELNAVLELAEGDFARDRARSVAATKPGNNNTIVLSCACGRSYRVATSQSGKKIKCKACGNTVQVPGEAPASSSPPAAAPAAAAPAAAPAAKPEPAKPAAKPEPAKPAAKPEPAKPEPAKPAAKPSPGHKPSGSISNEAKPGHKPSGSISKPAAAGSANNNAAKPAPAAAVKKPAPAASSPPARERKLSGGGPAKAAAPAKAEEAAPALGVGGRPAISLDDAWAKVVDDDSVNYCVFDFEGKHMVVKSVGSDGLNGLLQHFVDTEVMFAGLKVKAIDHRVGADGGAAAVSSSRNMLVAIAYLGKKVTGIRRSRILQYGPKAAQVMKGVTLTFQFPDMGALDSSNIAMRLLNSCGAHRPNEFHFGDGTVFDIPDKR